jgi:hypothetical protein
MDKTNKKKSILNRIFNSLSGAKETVKNYSDAIKSTHEAKNNVKILADKLSTKKAKELYTKNTGKEITPSMLKSESESGKLSKETQEYLKNKKKYNKEISKDYKTRFKL